MVLAEYKLKRQKLMSIPCTAQTDKKLKYVRYADDFLIAVKGSREDCQWIKSKLAEFIGDVPLICATFIPFITKMHG